MTKPLTKKQRDVSTLHLQELSGEAFFAHYGMKLCFGCRIAKYLLEFPFNSWSKDGRHNHCKKCYPEYIRKQNEEYER